MQRFSLRLCLFLLAGLALSGCWHVPLSALWRLRSIDMLTLDPAGLRLAARMPLWLDAQPGTVKARLTYARDGESERVEEFDLVESRDPAELASLAAEEAAGTHMRNFRLPATESARLRTLQAEAAIQKAADPNRKGSIKIVIDARACKRETPPPEGPILVDLFLSLGNGKGYFKILEDVDLREWAKPGERFETTIPPCGKWAARAG